MWRNRHINCGNHSKMWRYSNWWKNQGCTVLEALSESEMCEIYRAFLARDMMKVGEIENEKMKKGVIGVAAALAAILMVVCVVPVPVAQQNRGQIQLLLLFLLQISNPEAILKSNILNHYKNNLRKLKMEKHRNVLLLWQRVLLWLCTKWVDMVAIPNLYYWMAGWFEGRTSSIPVHEWNWYGKHHCF